MNNFCLHPVGLHSLIMEESMAITLDLTGYGKLQIPPLFQEPRKKSTPSLTVAQVI